MINWLKVNWQTIAAIGSVMISLYGGGKWFWKNVCKPMYSLYKEYLAFRETDGKFEEIYRRLDFQDKKTDGLIQLSAKPMFVCNDEGLCILANQALVELFGAVSVNQLKGLGWLQFIHPDDREKAHHDWETAIKSGAEDFTSHYRIVHGRTEEIIEASYHSIIGRDHENEALVAIGKVCKT